MRRTPTTRRASAGLLFAGLIVGCAGSETVSGAGTMRFENAPPVWRVNDRLDVPKPPENNIFPQKLYYFDAIIHRRLTNAMEMQVQRRALNVNALDEVPNSTWFTNRIGVRDMTPEEVARGPNADHGPDVSKPIRVRGTKVGGMSIGLLAKDVRGIKYLLKFDEPHVPVLETATDVVVARLLWAVGYNVPEDDVIFVRRDQLVLAEDAVVKDVFGNEKPMTVADLENDLARVYRQENGRYRSLSSRFLSGVPIGGFPSKGVRADDPNDLIAHEHRRDLRGLYVFFNWLQQTDAKEDNTLDMWIEDPADPSRHYVMHYLVDFGKALGVSATMLKHPADGQESVPDLDLLIPGALAFGLWKRPHEGLRAPGIEGVAPFDAEHFTPGGLKPHIPYIPFLTKDPYDAFWAAKIMMRLRVEHIRAAVKTGRYQDPRAVDYLTKVLVGRQRKAARYWFERVNPLDGFVVSSNNQDHEICFDDLLLKYNLEPGAAKTTKHRVAAFDFVGRRLAWSAESTPWPGSEGTFCVSGFPLGETEASYTIVSMTTFRDGAALQPVEIHLASAPSDNVPRIIGINRR